LIAVSALLPLAMTAILLGARALRRMPAGFAAWTGSQAAIAAGAGLVAARGQLPDWCTIVVANVLVVLGGALLADGFRRFYGLGRVFPRGLDAAVLVAAGALPAALLHGSVNHRIVVASVLYAFYLARAGLEPLRSGEARRSVAQRVLTLLEVVGAGLLLVRATAAAAAPPYAGLFSEGWTVVIPGLVLIIVDTTAMFVALVLTYERSDAQLRGALSEVKTLSGLLPICMHCHRIRNDKGYWDQLEKYLSRQTGAQFSHGICPDCYAELYPDAGNTGPRSRP
jgi:hypothetical protein